MRQRSFRLALSGLLFVLVVLSAARAIEAASLRWPLRKSRPPAEKRTVAPTEQIRSTTTTLNHYKAPWSTVLKKLAGATDSTLVMYTTPPGSFSRRDRDRYSRPEAVRILNRELEQQGFRLVEQGTYLVVLDLDMLRSRYRRPIVSASPDTTDDEPQPNVKRPPRKQRIDRRIETIASRKPQAASESPGRQPAVRQPVQRVASSEPARKPAKPIRKLDTPKVPPKDMIRQLVTPKNGGRIARELQPTLDLLVAQAAVAGDPRPAAPAPAPAADADAAESAGEQKKTGRTNGAGDPPAVEKPLPTETLLRIDGIKGPVTVQEIPGVGLVVTGNKEDVDAVIKIIEELDKIGKGTTPDIHLLLLGHVNSEALAELLTSVYEQLDTLRRRGAGQQEQTVSVISVVKPNAILILAPEIEMKSILKLANELDQPVDPDSELRVFPLRNAVASQVLEMLESFYEERGGLGTRVTVVADARTNSVIVQARPRDLAEVATLIRKIDLDESGAVSRMRIFELKHAVADELADVINTAVQSVLNPTSGQGQIATAAAGGAAGGNQTSRQLREAKSVVLEFLANDGKAGQIVRSGILADIRVTADTRINGLIVTAPEQSMALMAALIRQLDQPTSTVAEIKVFSLANADATASAELLQTLFDPQQDEDQLGIQVAGAEDASSSLVPLRFSVDIRTNSIIAIGGAEALQVVEAILLRLDEADLRQRKTEVIRLLNSPVVEVADAINQFLQAQRELARLDPELISNIELLEQEVIAVPEPVTNSLLLSVTPRYAEEITNLIERLDEAPAQVIIQALMVEVELENTDEFGVELGFQDSLLFDRGLLNLETFQTIVNSVSDPGTGIVTTTEEIVNSEGLPGFLFNNQQLGNNTAIRPGSVGTQGLSNFGVQRFNDRLGFGGLVLSANSEAVSVLVRALASKRDIHILSRPQIRTLDNQLAQIQVGQQVPIVDGVTVTGTGVANPLIRMDSAGIILIVTPRISPDGTIVMEVVAEKSQFTGAGVPVFTDVTTGSVVESPIKDITTVQTTVSVPNGQTIVLGGMITKTDDTLERKVPWLGDIPLLGRAFRYDGTSTRRTELLIFLTPRIIQSDADSEMIKQIEAERIHFFEEEAEEMHGPIFAVPPQAQQPDDSLPPLPPNDILPAPPAPADQAVPTTPMPNNTLPAPDAAPQGSGQSKKKRGLLSSFFEPFRKASN